MKTYDHIARAVFGQPWLIRANVLDTIAALVRFRAEGGKLSPEDVQARLALAAGAAGPRNGGGNVGTVGVIPIYGSIFPRANLMTDFSGGATISGIRSAFRQALADEAVGAILFDIDSPGGMTDGVEELATEIRQARGRKPMASIANYCMASAAYWIGSQADEVIASPSAMVGWIGCVAVHTEYSKADEMTGVTNTVIRHPDGKYGGNEYEPLTDKARTELQQMVDDYGNKFETDVAKARSVPVATVRSDFGEGGGMTAQRAKTAGLVDLVATYDEAITRLATGKVVSRRAAAADSVLQRVFLHRDDGTATELVPGPDGLVTADLGGEGEPMPPLENESKAAAEQDALELLRLKARSRSR